MSEKTWLNCPALDPDSVDLSPNDGRIIYLHTIGLTLREKLFDWAQSGTKLIYVGKV